VREAVWYGDPGGTPIFREGAKCFMWSDDNALWEIAVALESLQGLKGLIFLVAGRKPPFAEIAAG
jgi:hypothetical protein